MAVSDYAAAKRWLWQHGRAHEWIDRHHADLPSCAYLVCDVFWVTPENLLRDMRKDWDWTRQLYDQRRPSRRDRRQWGWR